MEIKARGESCAVYSNTKYEGKRDCMTVSRAAWLQALHDSSSSRSCKGASVAISSASASLVSGKIARRGENV